MKRICFLLNISPELAQEYAIAHSKVWPEMLYALSNAGWHNYSLFLTPEAQVIGYLETEDFEASVAAMQSLEINEKWQKTMARFFINTEDRPPDQAMTPLAEIFHLD